MLLTSLNIYFPAGAMIGDVKYTTDNAIASYISLLMSPICFVKNYTGGPYLNDIFGAQPDI